MAELLNTIFQKLVKAVIMQSIPSAEKSLGAPVNASIHNGMDMETFLRQLGIGVDMAMRSAAEGVPL